MAITTQQYFAQQNPVYFPAVRDVLSITNAFPAVVTTTYDGVNPGNHGYQTGVILRMNIPEFFGMQALNKRVSSIMVLSPSTFSINIDTTGLDPFVIPPAQPGHAYTAAQVTPIGETSDILTMSFVNQLTPQF